MVDLVTIAPGHALNPAAAAAWERGVAAGCPVAITSSYRPPQRQAEMRAEYLVELASWRRNPVGKKKPTYVAAVADSEHVIGNALDLKDPAIAWMRAHPEYGFVFTDPTERWHVAYRFAQDRHLTSTAVPVPPAPRPQEDDTMKPLFIRAKSGAIVIVTPSGVHPLTLEQWVVWQNLGYKVTHDEMDQGPFDAVVASLGGLR